MALKSPMAREFPDFPPLDVQMPDGFADCSSAIEGCPSFENQRLGLRIYVDYPDPARRDIPGEPRFRVQRLADGTTVLGTDDWHDVADLVETSGPSNVVQFARRAKVPVPRI